MDGTFAGFLWSQEFLDVLKVVFSEIFSIYKFWREECPDFFVYFRNLDVFQGHYYIWNTLVMLKILKHSRYPKIFIEIRDFSNIWQFLLVEFPKTLFKSLKVPWSMVSKWLKNSKVKIKCSSKRLISLSSHQSWKLNR